MESTNYFDTFIEIAEDCPATMGEIPPLKGDKKSIANLQFEMLSANPYTFTSDDILYSVFATRKEIPKMKLKHKDKYSFPKDNHAFDLHH